MINKTNPIQYMDTLLGSDFSELLSSITGSMEIINNKLEENKKHFEKKIAALKLSSSDPEIINATLQLKLKSIEKSLQTHFAPESLASREGIKKIVEYTYKLFPDSDKVGWYIKKTSAETILQKLPPKNLLAFIEQNGNSVITEEANISPLQLLAITRHTESNEWQSAYIEYLTQLTPDDFEERSVDFMILDTKKLKPLLDKSEQHQKPWRISHTKETGTVTCFSLDNYETYPLPILLYLSVLIHYFFETSCSGSFFSRARTHNYQDFGLVIKKIITTGINKFQFFHPNSYSENLFWKKAIKLLGDSRASDELNYFVDTLSCGEQISSSDTESSIISLNIVDHIWSANFSNKISAEEYFKLTSRNYLYHFREGLWYEIFREIIGLTEEQMDMIIIEHLDSGDIDFTDLMVNKYLKNK